MKTEPYHECPRFDRCSVNHCPLDPSQDTRQSRKDDLQPKCTLEKSVRARIGAKYADILPMLGLTRAEFAARNYKAPKLTPEQIAKRNAGLEAWKERNKSKNP